MIGMANSDVMKQVFAATISCIALLGGVNADVVTMTGGVERLSGSLRSIEDGGVLELQSELSGEPLRVRASMVGKVDFATDAVVLDPAPARVELINGDVIPCSVVAMDADGLVAESAELGKIRIDRRHLAAMQFGVRRNKVLYAATQGMEGWSVDDEEDPAAWRFEDGAMVSMGQSIATRKIGFPEQFILKFELEWARNSMPAIQMFFADPLAVKGERCDRYCLAFGSTGFEIKRESATQRRFTTIAYVSRMPAQCPDRRLRVELQVDRRDATLRLLLDGKLEGEFADPVEPPPTGAGLVLVSQAEGVQQQVRGFEVLESDNAPRRHRAESRGVADRDSLITRRDERWSGVLEEISTSGAGPVLRFRSDFGDKRIELPTADASTVFFSRPALAEGAAQKPSAAFLLSYVGDGLMRISSCRFADDVATIQHPLLGSLQLRRNLLRSIERESASSTQPSRE